MSENFAARLAQANLPSKNYIVENVNKKVTSNKKNL